MSRFEITQFQDYLEMATDYAVSRINRIHLSRLSDGWYLSASDEGNHPFMLLVQEDIYAEVDPYALCLTLIRMVKTHDLAPWFEAQVTQAIKFMEQSNILPNTNADERKETELAEDKIYKLIEAADKCRKEIVLCLMGKPGIGKTEAVERFARDHSRNVVHIIASQILPSEVSGMTMPNQETKSMDIFDHYRLSHMEDGDILFFDELLKGQQQVLNACLTLIQERRLMSGTKLPDVLVIAAANPLATPAQLPVEIRQRFLFVDVEWNQRGWIDYMKKLGFTDEEQLVKLAGKVGSSLDRTDRWNTLTPRTATKLCLWLRASGDSPSVRDYILSTFGGDVLSRISGAVNGSGVKKPEVQLAQKVIDFIDEHGDEEDPEDNLNSAGNRRDVMAQAEAVVMGESTDMSGLLDTLMKLPEWEQIQEVLQATEIEKEKIEF